MVLFTWLAKSMVSSTLENICTTSLDIISNASSSQINAAIDHNKDEINKILVKLLTINFLSKNANTIENETKEFNKTTDKPDNQLIKGYCGTKLLEISPIHGFFQNDYFLHYNISSDLQSHILTFIRPLQLFESVSLLNKQFNRNVKTMHESTNEKYSNVFSSKNFTFESFTQLKNYCARRINSSSTLEAMIDVERAPQCFKYGYVTNVNNFKKVIDTEVPLSNGHMLAIPGCSSRQVAPFRSMTFRPCNLNRFKNNIIKHGYCGETCDINLSKYSVPYIDHNNINTTTQLIHFGRGLLSTSAPLDYENNSKDFWACCKIDWDGSLRCMLGKYISQIYVWVDISKIWTQFGPNLQQYVTAVYGAPVEKENRQMLAFCVHPDSCDIIKPFGSKTNKEQQLDAKKMVREVSKFRISMSQFTMFGLIGRKSYCTLTPHGPCSPLTNQEKFDAFCQARGVVPQCFDNEILNYPTFENIDDHVLSKIKFDRNLINGELKLWIKIAMSNFMLDFEDETAPEPLKKRYFVAYNSFHPRVINATISDSRLKSIKSDDDDVNDIDSIKNELLKWKGFVKIKFNITKEFNQFQERLIDESNGKINHLLNNNRKYFVNSMPYLEWDQQNDNVFYNRWVALEDENTLDYDHKSNYFDWFDGIMMNNKQYSWSSLWNYFLFFCDMNFVHPVCKKWRGI